VKNAFNDLGKHSIGQGKLLNHHKPILLYSSGDISDIRQISHPPLSSQVPLISSHFPFLNFSDDVVNLCLLKVLVFNCLLNRFLMDLKLPPSQASFAMKPHIGGMPELRGGWRRKSYF